MVAGGGASVVYRYRKKSPSYMYFTVVPFVLIINLGRKHSF